MLTVGHLNKSQAEKMEHSLGMRRKVVNAGCQILCTDTVVLVPWY